MLPFKLNTGEPLKILCLGAHCDDIEIGAGCFLLKLFAGYKIDKVTWVVFSSDKVREKEARESAEEFMTDIETKEIIIHSYRDGFLPFYAAEIKESFERIKSRISPDIIFTHYRDDRHQDHRLISDLTWNTWRNNLILEYEIPKYDGDLGIPNLFVQVDRELLAKRNAILLKNFKSQSGKHWFSDETFRALPRLRGMEAVTDFAEAFYARKIVMY